MKQFKAIIIDEIGLHARPASYVVNCASQFNADIKIKSNSREANLKSIMNVMALCIKHQQEFEVTANGSDEDVAIKEIIGCFKKHKLISS